MHHLWDVQYIYYYGDRVRFKELHLEKSAFRLNIHYNPIDLTS